MNPNNPPARRPLYYPLALGIAVVACFALLLIGVTGGLLSYVVLAIAAIALVGLLHYAVWGHNMPAAHAAVPNAWQTERDREHRH
jgi:hypothetical protein